MFESCWMQCNLKSEMKAEGLEYVESSPEPHDSKACDTIFEEVHRKFQRPRLSMAYEWRRKGQSAQLKETCSSIGDNGLPVS